MAKKKRKKSGRYKFTPKRRAALNRARRKPRNSGKASDTFGHYFKKVPGMLADAVTMGKATTISNLVERKDAQHRRRYGKYRTR